MKKHILIIAGEPSGDYIGGPLVENILSKIANINIFGFGGNNMQNAGVEILCHINKLSFMGIIEVIRHLPQMYIRLRDITIEAMNRNCIGAILIDYPGFNIKLAQKLKKNNIPVVYIVSPQIWAWKSERIQILKDCVKKMLVILPFEEKIYRDALIPVKYIGHPFIESVIPSISVDKIREENNIQNNDKVLLLLPGSREQEVSRLLDPMISAFQILNNKINNLKCIIAKSDNVSWKYFEKVKYIDNISVLENKTIDCMFIADAAITCSGSATLQCACALLPHIVTYKTNIVNSSIYKKYIKTKYISLTNLVAEKQIVPELLLSDATPENMATALYPYISDISMIENMRNDLKSVRGKLGEQGVFQRATEEIIATLQL